MGFMDFLGSSGGGNIIGSTIGAIGGFINGKNSVKAQREANAQNLALAREQMELQKEFAQNGVRWKVADAQAAGIHPLAALGANTATYTPTAAMVEPVNDNALGNALSQMGQGVSRAFEAKQLKEEREAAQARQEMADVFNMARTQKELEHMDLQNEFLRTQIAGAKNAVTKTALPPAMPKVNDAETASITSDIEPLLSPARIGNAVLLHINPNISDSITEDIVRNMYANIAAEAKMGKIAPEISKFFSKRELDAVKRGDAEIVYTAPSTFQFLWKPHMKPRYDGNRQTVRGKIIF